MVYKVIMESAVDLSLSSVEERRAKPEFPLLSGVRKAGGEKRVGRSLGLMRPSRGSERGGRTFLSSFFVFISSLLLCVYYA